MLGKPAGLVPLLVLAVAVLTSCSDGFVERERRPIEHVDLSLVADGIYFSRFRDNTSVREVGVLVRSHRIVEIRLLRFRHGCPCLPPARGLRKKVLAQQTPRIDAVSGATRHTRSMLRAIETALKKGIQSDEQTAS